MDVLSFNKPNMNSDIYICYTNFENELSDIVYKEYLSRIPKDMQERNLKYLRWQDRHAHLLGRLLLLEALPMLGLDMFYINKISYNSYGRPFLPGNIDFNISHSGQYIICAAGKNVRIGVDIEQMREINFDHFSTVMTPQQWESIQISDCPVKNFFKYWAIKESVIKADGRGLTIPLNEIRIDNDSVFLNSKHWFLKELHLDNNYSAFLASSVPNYTLNMTYYNF